MARRTGPLTVSGAMATTATIYTQRLDVSGATLASFQLTWTGTPVGTFTVQGTNRLDASDTADTGWIDLTLDDVIASPAGGASSTMVEMIDVTAHWLRIKYVNASGSGALTVVAHSKG